LYLKTREFDGSVESRWVHDVVWNACVDLDGKGSSLSKVQIKNL